MSDFDKQEWMEEYGKKTGEAWVPLVGRPTQEFCDIRTKKGKEIGPCWPKSAEFIDLSSDNEERIPLSSVTHVRYYESNDDQADVEKKDEETEDDLD